MEEVAEEVFRKTRKNAIWLLLNGRPFWRKGAVWREVGAALLTAGQQQRWPASLEPQMGHGREGRRLMMDHLSPILENKFGLTQR